MTYLFIFGCDIPHLYGIAEYNVLQNDAVILQLRNLRNIMFILTIHC